MAARKITGWFVATNAKGTVELVQGPYQAKDEADEAARMLLHNGAKFLVHVSDTDDPLGRDAQERQLRIRRSRQESLYDWGYAPKAD